MYYIYIVKFPLAPIQELQQHIKSGLTLLWVRRVPARHIFAFFVIFFLTASNYP